MRRRESSVRFLASNGAMSQRTAKQARRAARQARPPRRLARRRWLWASTVARWLAEDALKPWQHRSWIFPTDAGFLEKAGPVLDLYQGRWQGKLLHPGEFVICADEKPSIQARRRIHGTLPPAPRSRGHHVEHTYQRGGALTYLAALDIGRRGGRRPRVFGRSEPRGGIAPFDRLVWQVMTKQPYASARRVFWIVDNGSSHRGRKSVERLERRWPNLVLVHLPVHASWLNQIEIYVRHEAPCIRSSPGGAGAVTALG